MQAQAPFRADQVGSLLRPAALAETRARFKRGEVDAAALRAAEDAAITEAVRRQEAVGLQGITDGEFRRTYFHIDFLEQLGGVKTDIPVTIKKPDGSEELAPPVIRVVDKVRHAKNIQLADFQYLKSQVKPGLTPKRASNRSMNCAVSAISGIRIRLWRPSRIASATASK